MKQIKDIIAENLVTLRKQKNFTQEEVAKKLNYSDNTISRWERGELCPSVEMLEAIANIYEIPIEYLLKENLAKRIEGSQQTKVAQGVSFCAISVSFLFLAVTILFFCMQTFFKLNLWILFVWPVPVSLLIFFNFAFIWRKRTAYFILFTLFIWAVFTTLYLQFLEYNLWMLFLIAIPCQVAWTIWCYVRPNKRRTIRNKQKKQ